MNTHQDIAAAVAGARDAMDGFMAAFNAEDREAMQKRWLHFPHVRFHSGRVTVMETSDDFAASVWERKGEAEGAGPKPRGIMLNSSMRGETRFTFACNSLGSVTTAVQ